MTSPPNDTIIARLSAWYSGDIHDCLDALGIQGWIPGLQFFGKFAAGGSFCGRARTVQFVPSRHTGAESTYHSAIDELTPGQVMVIDVGGRPGSCLGELMSLTMKLRGAAGAVVNGTVRDVKEIEKNEFAVFAVGSCPMSVVGRSFDVSSNTTVEIGGVRIQPNDVVFADADGVVVVPQSIAEIVADRADKLGRRERVYRERIIARDLLVDIFRTHQ